MNERATGCKADRARYRIAWLMAAPSPMLRGLLRAAAVEPRLDLDVLLCADSMPGRAWRWEEQTSGYRARRLRGSRLGAFCVNPEIIRVCIKECYDLFIVNSYDQPTSQLAMLTLSIFKRRWALANERPGINAHSFLRNTLRKVALSVPKHYAPCAIGVGALAARAFADLFGDGRPSYSLPYVFDMEPFLAVTSPPMDRGVRFAFCGQLIRRKGVDILCRAAAAIFETTPDAELVIAGDGPERWQIDQLRFRFPNRVHHLGYVPFDERERIYSGAHVFVFPSRHDGWGMVVHEAMACGLPVISSHAVGAAHDLVIDGINGFMVEPGSSAAVTGAMQYFVNHRTEIPIFGERARQAAQRYTPQWGVRELIAIIEGRRDAGAPIATTDKDNKSPWHESDNS
jgi:glycosyltransferase involved in cell wall biosynthesis